jgi:phosphate-selective porin OprO/OprP
VKIRYNAVAGAVALLLPYAQQTAAQEAAPTDAAALQQRLDEQEQRLRILERRLELADDAAAATAASAAQVRASATRFSLQSADGANAIRLRGVLHFDGRHFGGDSLPGTADTWILRRVRPTVEGTFGNIFDFKFTPDFAGGRTIILDSYVTARFKPWAAIQAGKFKVPVGLERLQSASDIRFIERAFPTSLVPNRDLGVQITGDIAGGVVNYSLGYFNGVTDGASSDNGTPADAETDTAGDWAARVFFQPFLNSDSFGLRGLGFGIAGTYVNST